MDNIILNNTNAPLFDYQLKCIKEIKKKQKVLLSVDTGCGKSYIMTSLLLNFFEVLKVKGEIAIITAPTEMVDELYKLLVEFSGNDVNIIKTTGSAQNVRRLLNNLYQTTIIVCTHSTWGSTVFSCMVNNYAKQGYIKLLICDECSLKENEGLTFMLNIAQYVEYVVYSNASPTTSKSDNKLDNRNKFSLLYKLLRSLGYCLLNEKDFKSRYVVNISDNSNKPHYQLQTNKFNGDFGKAFVNINRDELGVEIDFDKVYFHRCDAKDTESKVDLYYKNLSPSNPAYYSLINTLIENKDKKILVYTSRISVMEILREKISQMGINCMVINGENNEDILGDLQKFNNELESGVLITNYIKGINVGSSNVLICYGTPSDILQLIARPVRGMVKKYISLHIIYFPQVDKEDIESIYSQLYTIQEVLGRKVNLLQYIEEELNSIEAS